MNGLRQSLLQKSNTGNATAFDSLCQQCSAGIVITMPRPDGFVGPMLAYMHVFAHLPELYLPWQA
jgi:hypothetical protein